MCQNHRSDGRERLGKGTKGTRDWAEGPRGLSGEAPREAIVARLVGASTTLCPSFAFRCQPRSGGCARPQGRAAPISRGCERIMPRCACDRAASPRGSIANALLSSQTSGNRFPRVVLCPLLSRVLGTDQPDSIFDRASKSGVIPKPLPSPIAIGKTVVLIQGIDNGTFGSLNHIKEVHHDLGLG